MAEKRERGQLTLKGNKVTPEFVSLVCKIAERNKTIISAADRRDDDGDRAKPLNLAENQVFDPAV